MVTNLQFTTFEQLFDYYNKKLFNGELPDCMINMSRKKNSNGFFAPERWQDKDDKRVHEISLNPDSLHRSPIEWQSTLVHEMVHLWQEWKGKKTTSHHDREWADKMENIGLMPSDTGQPGGKRTGQKMTHYVIPNGAFELAFKEIAGANFEKLTLPYKPVVYQAITKKGTKSKSGVKIKYSCACGNNVWGREGLKITCDECNELFEPNI